MDLQKNTSGNGKTGISPLSRTEHEIQFIEGVTSRIFGRYQLSERSRKHDLVKARQTVYYMVWKYIMPARNLTWKGLAARYGQHHSTALHGKAVVHDLIETRDPVYYLPISTIDKAVAKLKKEYLMASVLEPEFHEDIKRAAFHFADKHRIPVSELMFSFVTDDPETDNSGLHIWKVKSGVVEVMEVIHKPEENETDDNGQSDQGQADDKQQRMAL